MYFCVNCRVTLSECMYYEIIKCHFFELRKQECHHQYHQSLNSLKSLFWEIKANVERGSFESVRCFKSAKGRRSERGRPELATRRFAIKSPGNKVKVHHRLQMQIENSLPGCNKSTRGRENLRSWRFHFHLRVATVNKPKGCR